MKRGSERSPRVAMCLAAALIVGWALAAAGCGSFVCNEIWSGSTNDQIVESSPTVVNGILYIGSADKNFPENISGRIYVFALP